MLLRRARDDGDVIINESDELKLSRGEGGKSSKVEEGQDLNPRLRDDGLRDRQEPRRRQDKRGGPDDIRDHS